MALVEQRAGASNRRSDRASGHGPAGVDSQDVSPIGRGRHSSVRESVTGLLRGRGRSGEPAAVAAGDSSRGQPALAQLWRGTRRALGCVQCRVRQKTPRRQVKSPTVVIDRADRPATPLRFDPPKTLNPAPHGPTWFVPPAKSASNRHGSGQVGRRIRVPPDQSLEG